MKGQNTNILLTRGKDWESHIVDDVFATRWSAQVETNRCEAILNQQDVMSWYRCFSIIFFTARKGIKNEKCTNVRDNHFLAHSSFPSLGFSFYVFESVLEVVGSFVLLSFSTFFFLIWTKCRLCIFLKSSFFVAVLKLFSKMTRIFW